MLCRDDKLSFEDFPKEIRGAKRETTMPDMLSHKLSKPLPDQMDEIEKKLIIQALAESNGQAATAARKLGISRQSLLYKMNKFFITS